MDTTSRRFRRQSIALEQLRTTTAPTGFAAPGTPERMLAEFRALAPDITRRMAEIEAERRLPLELWKD